MWYCMRIPVYSDGPSVYLRAIQALVQDVTEANGQILWSVQPSQLVLFSASYFIIMQGACRMEWLESTN